MRLQLQAGYLLCLAVLLSTGCATMPAGPALDRPTTPGETAAPAGPAPETLPAIGEKAAPAGPAPDTHLTIGEKAALTAVAMIGRPYKYKGNTPAGFDCSGLVQYSYLAAGLENVPHGTKTLRKRTRPIGKDLQTGDLLFFNERGKKYSHVGIYLENDTFVHAPGTGGWVKKDSLEDPYYKDHFVEARRFL